MDRTNRNTALASAFVEELARCGVRHAVLSPGSRSSPLALALRRAPAVEVTVIVDERSAGFFALGAAQAGGEPVAVLTTSGTAAANLHPAVAEADESAVPLIVLTADRPPELRGIGAGQTIDQIKLYGDAVRWFCEVGTHDADDAGLLHYRSTACRAYAVARGDPRPGPVHLNLAWRDPLGPEPHEDDVTASSELALEGRDGRPLTTVVPASSPPPEPLVDALGERIAVADRGLIVAGRQPDDGPVAAIVALAEATGFPVLADPTSQLRFGPHDHGMVISAYEAIARLRPKPLEPDLVLRFGEMPTCKPLRQWLEAVEDLPQVAMDARFGWNEPSRRAGALVRADPTATAGALAERHWDRDEAWSRSWVRAADAAAQAIDLELGEVNEPSEPGVHRALAEIYEDGDLVYTASSMPIRDQEAFLPGGPESVRFLANRGANGIDGLVSSGVGAALATGRSTWIVTGDLGLFHDMNGLAAIRHARAPVRVLVLNNGGGGIFEFLPQAEQVGRDEFEAVFGTPMDLDLERVAALYDLPYRRVDDLGGLGPAVEGDRALIEIPVDRRANVELHRRLTEAATTAVERTLSETKETTG